MGDTTTTPPPGAGMTPEQWEAFKGLAARLFALHREFRALADGTETDWLWRVEMRLAKAAEVCGEKLGID